MALALLRQRRTAGVVQRVASSTTWWVSSRHFSSATTTTSSSSSSSPSSWSYLESLVRVNYETVEDKGSLRRKWAQDDVSPLGAIKEFLSVLNEPQRTFPVVHVVGSKGKGSTSSLLTDILRRSGIRVGTYTRYERRRGRQLQTSSSQILTTSLSLSLTLFRLLFSKSPHILSLGERIQINGVPSDESEILQHFKKHSEAIAKVQERTEFGLTFFEALTGLALRYFADQNVDLAIVEAGLGGVNDATNVFSSQQLKLVIVTFLEEEHTDVLGEKISDIISAKVGVVKRGTPIVVAAQSSREIEDTVVQKALSLECGTLLRTSEVCKVAESGCDGDGSSGEKSLSFEIESDFLGDSSASSRTYTNVVADSQSPAFVVENFRTALTAATLLTLQSDLGIEVVEDDVQNVLLEHKLPGRFQVLARGEDRHAVVLDGAHTPNSARALVSSLNTVYKARGYHTLFVVGMAKDKDVGSFLQELAKANPKNVLCTQAPFFGTTSRSCPPQELQEMAEQLGLAAEAVGTFEEALELSDKIVQSIGEKTLVCFTGSFRIVSAYLLSSPE